MNELARILDLDPGNLHRKLVELEKEGFLRSKVRGNQKYYYLNTAFPLLEEYTNIIQSTTGVLEKRKDVSLPDYFRGILWAYDISKMDLDEDKDRIITNTLIYGTEEMIEWIFTYYSIHEIRNCVIDPLKGEWDKKSLFFWAKMLRIPLAEFEPAILDVKV